MSLASGRLRSAREAKSMSQAALARVAGLRPAQVSRFEAGGGPSVGNLRKLAHALGVSSDFLLGLSAEMAGSDRRRPAFDSLEWRTVAVGTEVADVPGGWLVQVRDFCDESGSTSVALVFIPEAAS